VALRSPVPRLTDIVEAIERIHGVLGGVSLKLSRTIGSGSGWWSAVSKSFPKPAATCPMS
jgi:hypothetical protein